jgi:hypothetical protein
MSARARRALNRSRETVLAPVNKKEPKPQAVRRQKFNSLPLAKLHRRIHQFSRRAATAKLSARAVVGRLSIPPGSLAQQDANIALFKQAVAESQARLLAVKGKLAPIEIPNPENP